MSTSDAVPSISEEHYQMVANLKKDPEAILATLTPAKVDLWHMATGVATEAGELLDAIKKHTIYGKPLDVENVIEELGDLRFYMKGLFLILRLTEDQVDAYNMQKLSKGKNARYAQGYSDAAAIARSDKEQPSVPNETKVLRNAMETLVGGRTREELLKRKEWIESIPLLEQEDIDNVKKATGIIDALLATLSPDQSNAP